MKESDLSVHCRVEISDPGWDVDESLLKTLVARALHLMGPELATIPGIRHSVGVSCYFVPAERMQALNREQRGTDAVTDMLSFPLGYPLPGTGWVLGDIVICLDAIEQKAASSGNQMPDQLVFSLVHSLLHLLGLDHLKEQDRLRMEQREEEVFRGIAGHGAPEVARRLA
ncbi:MAG: rRNA maturation RNase YbeY [Candidatus Cryosericum sp.]